MADVQALEVPVKGGLELGAIIGLDDVHPERQAPERHTEPSGRIANPSNLPRRAVRPVFGRDRGAEPATSGNQSRRASYLKFSIIHRSPRMLTVVVYSIAFPSGDTERLHPA